MTCPRRDGREVSEYARWRRHHPELDSIKYNLSIPNIDWVIHQFECVEDRGGRRRLNNLMLVEEKTFCKKMDFAQSDSLFVLSQFLPARQDGQPAWKRVRTLRGNWIKARFWGCHLMTFSGAGPETSQTIWWDGTPIDLQTLVDLHKFAVNPFTLRRRDLWGLERRHHSANGHLPGVDW